MSRTLSSQPLSRSRFCFSLSPYVKKVVQQVLFTSLLFSSECFGKGFYCILPWHASLLWSEFSCALLSGCVAQLNGSSYRTTGKQNTFYPCPHPQREKEALQVPTDFGLWTLVPQTLVPWVGLPDFVLVKLWRVTVDADQLKGGICNSTGYSLVFHLDLFLFLYQIF